MPLILVLAMVALLGACNDPCEFRERCSGNAVESCVGLNDGPHISVRGCPEPNTACVEPSENRALCVSAPAAVCDGTFESRCEGTLRVFCNTAGFIEAADCVALGTGGCRLDEAQGGAVCE